MYQEKKEDEDSPASILGFGIIKKSPHQKRQQHNDQQNHN